MSRIVIVGAGPSGSTAALSLARSGRHEVILLDRDHFPRMKTCGSGLSPRCIKLSRQLGIDRALQPKAYGIRGLHFAGPTGKRTSIAGKEGAWVVARSDFDAELAFSAERAGAKFQQGVKVTKALRDQRGRVVGVSDGKTDIEADLTLFAEGAHTRFSPDERPKKQIATIMGWYEGVPFTEGMMEMWFDRRVAPWYGWLFPENKTRVNIGICYDPDDPGNPRDIFQEIVDRHVGAERMKNATQVIKFRGAPIVYTDSVGPVAQPGALWIGEAARLTHALTGEGIGFAMQSAMVAADCINKFPDEVLGAQYTQALKWAFTPHLKFATALTRFAVTPAFATLTGMLSLKPVEKAITYALAYV